MFENITSSQLNRAAQIKERIEALEQELQQIIGGSSAGPAPAAAFRAGSAGGKGQMSAAGKARIAAAQRARWAKVRAQRGINGAASPSASKPKRTMSAAGRAKIAAAARRRWAKARAAGRNAL